MRDTIKEILSEELVKQYHVRNLPDLLLSPRTRLTEKGYTACSGCCKHMQRVDEKRTNPPKFANTNVLFIGSIPMVISFVNNEGNRERESTNICEGRS